MHSLRRVPVDTCAPNAILLTPIYVYLPKNKKFIAVKAPLQLFSVEELEKLKSFENFYFPEFIDLIAPFQKAGEAVREILKVRQRRQIRSSGGTSMIPLPMAQHELNDALLRIVGPLWGRGVRVEPFFLCFFADAVCEPLPASILGKAAEQDGDRFELSLLRASTAVFLALHLGYGDVKLLTCLRDRVFQAGTEVGPPIAPLSGELGQLFDLVEAVLPDAETREISFESIRKIQMTIGCGGRSPYKLRSRLNRVRDELMGPKGLEASLYGEKGIRNE
jgi:hypothetical protein